MCCAAGVQGLLAWGDLAWPGLALTRGATMKSRLLASAAAIAFVLGCSIGTDGQSGAQFSARVPFDFMVGNKMFPNGEYRVNSVGRHTLVLSAQNGYAFVVMKTSHVSTGSNTAVGIAFINDGHHYRLLEVTTAPGAGERFVKVLPAGRHQSVRDAAFAWVVGR